MQHRGNSAAIRKIFDRINQRESRSQLRLHFILPIANLKKRREGGNRRMRDESSRRKCRQESGTLIGQVKKEENKHHEAG